MFEFVKNKKKLGAVLSITEWLSYINVLRFVFMDDLFLF